MIAKHEIVDDLITKLLIKFKAEGSNTARTPSPYLEAAMQFRIDAPFLNINSYLYFLSEMGFLALQLHDGTYVTFYGLDDWDEGLNILEFPVPAENGFHLILDIFSPEGEALYFSYNSNAPGEDVVWVSKNVEDGPYATTEMSFVEILKAVYEENFLLLNTTAGI